MFCDPALKNKKRTRKGVLETGKLYKQMSIHDMRIRHDGAKIKDKSPSRLKKGQERKFWTNEMVWQRRSENEPKV
jgi:hypothetical protein